MAGVEKKAKRRAAKKQGIKNPVAYSWVGDVDTTMPDEQTLLGLIKKLDITSTASKHVEGALFFWIGEFRQRMGYLVGAYRARTHINELRATPRDQRAYAARLEKYVTKTGTMPEGPHHWPPSVRYNKAVIDGAHPLEAVKQYNRRVHETNATPGQPTAIDKDCLIVDADALIKSYGVRNAESRQYAELVLKASGVDVPDIGDSDGRALRIICARCRR